MAKTVKQRPVIVTGTLPSVCSSVRRQDRYDMKRLIFVIVGASALAACAPDVAKTTTGPTALGVPGIRQLSNATVAVLDGMMTCDGACKVTKWLDYPTEPISPTYFVQSYEDPCFTKWGGTWHTYRMVDEDGDEYYELHWCQQ